MNDNLGIVSNYIVTKNELKKARNRARAKSDYYFKLYTHHGKPMTNDEAALAGFRGWAKWNKPGKKQVLRMLYKKYLIEQLSIENQIHNLVISSRKKLLSIKKETSFKLAKSTDLIVGIQVEDTYYKLDKIQEMNLNYQVETFLLRSERDAV